jgi:hypothetical protein
VHPLVFLLENVPEDFLITQEDSETGLYNLRAAVGTSAVGWNIHQKMGRPLHEIHGPVPDYKEKMAFSMDRHVTWYMVSGITHNNTTMDLQVLL